MNGRGGRADHYSVRTAQIEGAATRPEDAKPRRLGTSLKELRPTIPWALLLAASAAAFLVLQTDAALDLRLRVQSADGHFYVVSAVALANLALGAVAGVVAWRSTNTRVLMLALSFISMSTLFAVHGLATPGFIVDSRFAGVTGFTSRLSVLVASAFLALSAVESSRAPVRWLQGHHDTALLGWIGALAAFVVVALTRPQSIPPGLVTHSAVQAASALVVAGLSGFAAMRYLRGYQRTGLPMYGAVALGSALVLQAQISMHFGAVWGGTFWLYHVQLLVGFAAIVWGLFAEVVSGSDARRSIERLAISDAVEQVRAGYAGSIVSLAAALEARDGYTLGHGERVAALAVLMAREMRVPESQLRAISQGALLHDIGKIGVPDAILHKPGGLSDDEYEQIQEHPARGETVLASAFQGDRYRIERGVIRHHHERWDGSGYPDGLDGERIPLGARITAVADVYDALRSARSYREAWDRDRSVAQILDGAGSHFDRRCVEAFVAVVEEWESRFAADHAEYQQQRAA